MRKLNRKLVVLTLMSQEKEGKRKKNFLCSLVEFNNVKLPPPFFSIFFESLLHILSFFSLSLFLISGTKVHPFHSCFNQRPTVGRSVDFFLRVSLEWENVSVFLKDDFGFHLRESRTKKTRFHLQISLAKNPSSFEKRLRFYAKTAEGIFRFTFYPFFLSFSFSLRSDLKSSAS